MPLSHAYKTWLAPLAGLLGLASLSACADEVTYAYFTIQVDIDRATVSDDLRRKIASCGIFVTGDDTDQFPLPCTLNSVPYNLGLVDFSSSRPRGTVKFTATMFDLNRNKLAEGTSLPAGIVKNSTVQTAVVAIGLVPDEAVPPSPDGGSRDAGAADAAVDAL